MESFFRHAGFCPLRKEVAASRDCSRRDTLEVVAGSQERSPCGRCTPMGISSPTTTSSSASGSPSTSRYAPGMMNGVKWWKSVHKELGSRAASSSAKRSRRARGGLCRLHSGAPDVRVETTPSAVHVPRGRGLVVEHVRTQLVHLRHLVPRPAPQSVYLRLPSAGDVVLRVHPHAIPPRAVLLADLLDLPRQGALPGHAGGEVLEGGLQVLQQGGLAVPQGVERIEQPP